MPFIGRKKELKILENAWIKDEALIMVSGRRYVGKTALIKAFLHNKNALYFTAENISDTMNRLAFEKAFRKHCGSSAEPEKKDAKKDSRKVVNWRDLFRLYAEKTEAGGKVLVIDNFDNLVQSNTEFPKLFKSAWQQDLAPNGVMVIVVLPNSATLADLIGNKNFMNQVTQRINLKPVTFVELMKEYPHHDFNQLMLLYSVAGGIPQYWHAFNNCIDDKHFRGAIESNIMDAHGELFNEAMWLLNAEVVDFAGYNSILAGLAQGGETIQDLADRTGFKTAKVEEYLENLIILDYVTKTTSIVERRFFGRKRVEYKICDPMISFWYTFVFPYYAAIQQGKTQNARKHLKSHFFNYIQYWFRQVATEIFMTASRQDSLPLNCDEVGLYFNHDEQIDVLGIDNTKKRVFFGDCAYSNKSYTKAEYDAFVERVQNIKELRRTFKDYEWVYGIFSAYPFESELLDYSLITKNVLLFNGITIYSLNT